MTQSDLDTWHDGLDHEKEFWIKWAKDGEEGFFGRKRELRQCVSDMLPEATPSTEILDVGAGAISWLGRVVGDVEVNIVQADPLADWYETIVKKQPNECHCVFGEELEEYFGDRKFDLVHATNSVDHSADPEAVLKGISAVTKGPIYLEHIQNCAIVNHWKGLHQWNFDQRDNRICIWGKHRQFVPGMKEPIDVAKALGVSAWNYRYNKHGPYTYIEFRGWL